MLLMVGFEPRSSGVGSDRSANCATPTAQMILLLFEENNMPKILLAKHFVSKFAREMNPTVKGLSTGALAAIDAWNWPGNVRELENRVKRAVIMAEGAFVTADDLDLGDGNADDLQLNLKAAREAADRKTITRAVARTEGNISNAAKLLGISRPTLYDLLKQYDLHM